MTGPHAGVIPHRTLPRNMVPVAPMPATVAGFLCAAFAGYRAAETKRGSQANGCLTLDRNHDESHETNLLRRCMHDFVVEHFTLRIEVNRCEWRN